MRTFAQRTNAARKNDASTHGHPRKAPFARHLRSTPDTQSAQPKDAENTSNQLEHDFTRVTVHPQRTITIGASNDPLEQDADRMADQVMRMPAPDPHGQGGKPGSEASLHARSGVQRKAHRPQIGQATAPTAVANAVQASGQPLGAAERRFFEPRFGHDFAQVRVHTNPQAAQSAHAIQARAYTLGQHIVFGRGEYAPDDTQGRRLLAHELTHVVQQGAGGSSGRDGVVRRAPNRELERQAAAKRLQDEKAGGVVTTYPYGETKLEDAADARLKARETNARIALGAMEDMRTGLDKIALTQKIISQELAQSREHEVHWVPPGFPGFIRRLEVLGHGTTGPKPENVGYTFAGETSDSGFGYSAADLREMEREGFDFSRYLVDSATVHLEGCLVGKGELGRQFLYQVGRLFFGLKNGYVVANTCLSTKSVMVKEIDPCDPVTYKWPEDFNDLLKADAPAMTGQQCDPLDTPPKGFGCFPSSTGDSWELHRRVRSELQPGCPDSSIARLRTQRVIVSFLRRSSTDQNTPTQLRIRPVKPAPFALPGPQHQRGKIERCSISARRPPADHPR